MRKNETLLPQLSQSSWLICAKVGGGETLGRVKIVTSFQIQPGGRLRPAKARAKARCGWEMRFGRAGMGDSGEGAEAGSVIFGHLNPGSSSIAQAFIFFAAQRGARWSALNPRFLPHSNGSARPRAQGRMMPRRHRVLSGLLRGDGDGTLRAKPWRNQ